MERFLTVVSICLLLCGNSFSMKKRNIKKIKKRGFKVKRLKPRGLIRRKSSQELFFDDHMFSGFKNFICENECGKITWEAMLSQLNKFSEDEEFSSAIEERLQELISRKPKDFCEKYHLVLESLKSKDNKDFWLVARDVYESHVSEFIEDLDCYSRFEKSLNRRAKAELSEFLSDQHEDLFNEFGIFYDIFQKLSPDEKFHLGVILENYHRMNKIDQKAESVVDSAAWGGIFVELASRVRLLDYLNVGLSNIISSMEYKNKEDVIQRLEEVKNAVNCRISEFRKIKSK